MKITHFILGSIFSVNAFAQMTPANMVSEPVFVPPTPLTDQILKNRVAVAFVNHPVLNKLSEVLVLADAEGLQADMFMNDFTIQNLNSLAQSANQTELRNQAGNLVVRILVALNHGFVTPDQLTEKTNVKVKPTPSTIIDSVKAFADGQITASQLMDLYRPKNPNYTKLLTIYKRFITMKTAGQIMEPPAKLGKVKEGSTEAASILFARQRLAMFGYENDVMNSLYTDDLKNAIESLQENNLLKRDGVIGPQSFGLLTTPIDQIITRLKINLDRTRWLPDDLKAEYVFINLAAQRLFYYKDSVITLTFRTVNGRVERPTPIMFDAINHMRLNPTWTVPRTIYYKDKVPALAKNPGLADEKHFKIFDNVTKAQVDPHSINWAGQTIDKPMLYTIVQSPGSWNALGFIKFPLVKNTFNIYMHDTNERNLFLNDKRMLSSGCIRLEKPFELAEKLLSSQIDPITGLAMYTVDTLKGETEFLTPVADAESKRMLGRTVPVYVLYETTQIDDKGQMTLVADPYGTDMDTYNLMMGKPVQSTVLGAAAE